MNRQFLSQIRDTQKSIPKTDVNPLDLYRSSVGPNIPKFCFKQISMSQLRATITTMKPTSSTTVDQISLKTIKQARLQLEPQILNLTNQILKTLIYPSKLKLTKIIPIPKTPKDNTRIGGLAPYQHCASHIQNY